MANAVPENLRYTPTHEWARSESDGTITFGITDYAQHALGDVVYIELPAVGKKIKPGDSFGVIESVKASSELYAPVGGEVVAINEALIADQMPINKAPYDEGWMIRVKPDGTEQTLLDTAAYRIHLEQQAH